MKFDWQNRLVGLMLLLVGVIVTPVFGRINENKLTALLTRLELNGSWGEAVLIDGRIRPLRVVETRLDSVSVREVYGPFQERDTIYALDQFRDLRELGQYRIPLRRAPFRGSRSVTVALLAEAVLPGAGYLYVGESRQGFSLFALGGVALATALVTGREGAPGWVPISTWMKIASLVNLVDVVGALNDTQSHLSLALLPGEIVPVTGGVTGSIWF